MEKGPSFIIGPGPTPYSCAHMAYVPRSSMEFRWDIQHDFRDYQIKKMLDFLSEVNGLAADIFQKAAWITGAGDPVLLDCLADDLDFDAGMQIPLHGLLARYWRAHELPRHLSHPHILASEPEMGFAVARSYRVLHHRFVVWGRTQVDHWAQQRPKAIALLCQVQVRGDSPSGQACLQELLDIVNPAYCF